MGGVFFFWASMGRYITFHNTIKCLKERIATSGNHNKLLYKT
jgi:hypothetical protein